MENLPIVTSVSGGKSSAYLAANYESDYYVFALVRIEDENCRFPDEKYRKKVEDRLQAPFIATSEMDEIIYTIFDLEQHLGERIHWVTGPTFEQVIKDRSNYLPNKASRFCTTELKIRPIFHFLHNKGAVPCITQIGFRAGEENRLLKKYKKCDEDGFEWFKASFEKHDSGRHKGNNKWEWVRFQKPIAPLIDDRVYRETVNRYFDDKDIRFAPFNNCVGCYWRNEPFLNKMSKVRPPKFDWFIDGELNSEGTWKTGITYKEIKEANFTVDMEFSDFSGCDSGGCGI